MNNGEASNDWAGVEIRPYSKKHFTITESSADDHARFLSLVGREPHAKGCHEWGGKRNHRGYGICTIKSVSILAHRLSYFIHNKKLSPELQVCHTCDNPPCVNPDHLFEGTAQDNARDRVKKGRHESKLRTHCPHGHEYTPENTRPHGRYKTQRQCITCQKESAAKSRRKKQLMEDDIKAKLAEAEKTIAELRSLKAVPPEARAVEAENILTAQLALPPDKRDWNEVHRAALSLRTVVPPGEGEEWAVEELLEAAQACEDNATDREGEVCIPWHAYNRLRAALKHAPARPTAAREDKARLDWLDAQTTALNQRFETTYGWRFDYNHNRSSLSITDCNLPALSIRAAIDAAMQQGGAK